MTTEVNRMIEICLKINIIKMNKLKNRILGVLYNYLFRSIFNFLLDT